MRRLVNWTCDVLLQYHTAALQTVTACIVLSVAYTCGSAHVERRDWQRRVRDRDREIKTLNAMLSVHRTEYVYTVDTVRLAVQRNVDAWHGVSTHPVTHQDTTTALEALPAIAVSDSALRASCGALIGSGGRVIHDLDTLVVRHTEKEQLLAAKPGPSRVRWAIGGFLVGVAAKVVLAAVLP